MKRPYVICHMCTTIDGKILVGRWSKLPGGQGGGGLFETTAAKFGIGAWLVGTTTMKEFSARPRALRRPAGPVAEGDFVAGRDAKSHAIGVDAKGVLRFTSNEVEGDHIVVLTTARASVAYRAHLREVGVSYLICGKSEIDLELAMKKLQAKFGLKKLMLQGGGRFNGAVLQAGLVDEISQVIVPIVDGGGPTITGVFDAPGKAPAKAAASLRLIRHDTLPGGAHWFRWRVQGSGK